MFSILDRPKAIVRPNNSANFDKVVHKQPVQIVAEENNIKQVGAEEGKKFLSLSDMISTSSNFIGHIQSRNGKLRKAADLYEKGRILEVLRSVVLDAAVTHDVLKINLEQPELVTLDMAVDMMTSISELSRSRHAKHINMASKASKFILTNFCKMIKDSQSTKVCVPYKQIELQCDFKIVFPTINQEERLQKCGLLSKLGAEIRDNLADNEYRKSDSQFANTIRELDIMLNAIRQ